MRNNTYNIAHSPDADDIFMYYAIKFGWITPPYPFVNIALDIDTLNKGALECKYDVCAISFSVYPLIAKEYALLQTGMSFGEGYGPKVIKKKDKVIKRQDFKVALSGEHTTNAMIFKMKFPQARVIYKNFLDIQHAVLNGEVDMGVLIHEEILNFDDSLEVYSNIWDIWEELNQNLESKNFSSNTFQSSYHSSKQSMQLPLPLGGMAIHRSIPLNKALEIENTLNEAIKIALKYKDLLSNMLINQSLVRVDSKSLEIYLDLYANEHSHSMSQSQIQAINMLFSLGKRSGFYSEEIDVRDYFLPREYLEHRHSRRL